VRGVLAGWRQMMNAGLSEICIHISHTATSA
jgi:hypothetical protein